jgi:hypothetical protein
MGKWKEVKITTFPLPYCGTYRSCPQCAVLRGWGVLIIACSAMLCPCSGLTLVGPMKNPSLKIAALTNVVSASNTPYGSSNKSGLFHVFLTKCKTNCNVGHPVMRISII